MSSPPGLTIVIPAYNEQARLGSTLSSVTAYLQKQPYPWEIIVVDDGSTDKTASVARSYGTALPVRVIRYLHNRGKGYALRTGVCAARGSYVLTYDADGAVPIKELDTLLPAVRDGSYDIVIASRLHHSDSSAVHMSRSRRFIGVIYALINRFLVAGIHDCSCGCKLYCRDVANVLFREQRINGFAHDVEILHLALRHGFRIKEIPVRWTAVPDSKVNLLTDGWKMFWSTVGLYLRRCGKQ